ncbi:MAG: DUF4381 family protein [Proteobacteria bacterium]|nr:DUF4381 family protein [Pseudomonadota bacterium]
MNPAAPSPTPAPLNDIVGPVWFWPYPLWMTLVAGLVLLLILAGFVWLLKKLLTRKEVPLTNRKKALAALEALRSGIAGVDPYAFGVTVSDSIRGYIRAEHRLGATTQTSLEFLNSIRGNPLFTDNEKAGLTVFLEKTDLLKFARAEAGEREMLDLLDIAARLVRGEAQSEKSGGSA